MTQEQSRDPKQVLNTPSDVERATPTIEWNADDVTFAYPVDGVTILFNHLHENSQGIDGHITVKSALHGLLHWSQMNLASLQARKSLIDKLLAAYPIEWRRKIEDACYEAATGFRSGEPALPLIPQRRSEEHRFWVNGFIPKTSVVLYGPGGEAKSLIALAVGASVASGTSIIGDLEVAESVPVLYLDFEDDREEHEDRLANLLEGAGLQAPSNFYYRKMPRPLIRDIGALRPEVAKLGIGLVILDSLSWAATPGLRWDEQAQEVFGAIRSLSPATPLVIGHVNSAAVANSSEPANPFGSVLVRNAARLTWEVRAVERSDPSEPLIVSLTERKRNRKPLSPHGFKIHFSDDSITIITLDVKETPELQEGKRQTTSLVLSSAKNGPKTYKRYAAETCLPYQTVKRTILRLVDQGRMAYYDGTLETQNPIDRGARYGLPGFGRERTGDR